MLSSVLRSARAVEVNIAIMRTFVQLRRLMDSNRDLARNPQLRRRALDVERWAFAPSRPAPFAVAKIRDQTSDIKHLTSDIRHISFPREALAHRNHPGRTGGFSPRARRAFVSREADYRLDLQETRRLLRRDDRFA